MRLFPILRELVVFRHRILPFTANSPGPDVTNRICHTTDNSTQKH